MKRDVSSEKTRGGVRRGAGRKKTGRCHDSPHRTRPSLSPRHPVHVVLRVLPNVLRLRNREVYGALRRVLVRYLGRTEFRVVHLSIQGTHLHFLIEAANASALRQNMQSLAINAARAINRSLGREGKLFAHRYHATQIRTSHHARHALAYVLNNWRRHREDLYNQHTMKAQLDPYATGFAFTGWSGAPRFTLPAGYTPLSVSPPATRLLRADWQRYGLVGLFETPGPLR